MATLTPYPPPTAIPGDPIPQGAAALQIGDYDTARAVYTAASSAPATQCAALYGLGLTDLQAGTPAAAEPVFTQAIGVCQNSPLLTFRAYVQRGEARRLLNRPADAISDYQQAVNVEGKALGTPGLLDSYLYERMAMAAGAGSQGTSTPDTTNELAYLQKAAAAPRYLAGTFALREQIASLMLTANNPTDAVKQYDLILAQATDANYRAQVEVEAGDALAKANQTTLANQRYNLVLNTYANAPAALNALIDLVNAGQPVDVMIRTQINVSNGNFAPVVNYLPDYLTAAAAAPSPTPIPAQLYLWLGQAERGIGQTAQALATFQKLRDSYPSDPLASAAALEQGRTQFQAKNYPAAISAYQAAAGAYPQSADAPEALWRAGYIAQNYGDPNQAVTIFDQLGTKYPQASQVGEASFAAGFILSKTDPKRAAAFFSRDNDAEGLLWQGKMLQQSGDSAGARKAWTNAQNQSPSAFFGLRAHDLLNNLTPYRPATNVHIPVATDTERLAAEQWLRSAFKLPPGTSTSTALSPALSSDLMLLRGTQLRALGWEAEARAEFDALHAAKLDDPVAMYQLAVYLHGIGANSSSIISAARVIVLSNQTPESVPPFLARLSYPIYYSDALIADARQYNLDPLYFASLIRLESNFDPQAHSVSDARGLTQFEPSTAQDVVNRLNWPPNYSIDDLYRPFVSLRMGAYYVDYVRRYVGGDLGATLAGYNAGPGAASNWVQQAGNDFDRLYETIDDSQAQDYIRYTYENDEMYRILYGG